MVEYVQITDFVAQLVTPLVARGSHWTTVFNVGTKRFRLTTSNIEADSPVYDKGAAGFIIRQAIVTQTHTGVQMMPTNVRFYWENGTYVIDIYEIQGP